MSGQHAITATSGMRLFSRVKTSKLCKIILITRKRRQADWRFDPFFIDSKNSSDLRFRDGFAADSPLQGRVRCELVAAAPSSRRRWLSPGKHRYPLSPRITILRKDVVDARRDGDPLGKRDKGNRAGAQIAGVDRPNGEETAMFVERELGLGGEVAAVEVGDGLGSSRPSGSYGGICGSARWRRAAFVMSMLNSLGRPLCTAP